MSNLLNNNQNTRDLININNENYRSFLNHMYLDNYVKDGFGNNSQKVCKIFYSLLDKEYSELKKLFKTAENICFYYNNSDYYQYKEYILKELEENNKILIPSGWSNNKSGHAISIYIEKNENEKYNIIITNSGEGCNLLIKVDNPLAYPVCNKIYELNIHEIKKILILSKITKTYHIELNKKIIELIQLINPKYNENIYTRTDYKNDLITLNKYFIKNPQYNSFFLEIKQLLLNNRDISLQIKEFITKVKIKNNDDLMQNLINIILTTLFSYRSGLFIYEKKNSLDSNTNLINIIDDNKQIYTYYYDIFKKIINLRTIENFLIDKIQLSGSCTFFAFFYFIKQYIINNYNQSKFDELYNNINNKIISNINSYISINHIDSKLFNYLYLLNKHIKGYNINFEDIKLMQNYIKYPNINLKESDKIFNIRNLFNKNNKISLMEVSFQIPGIMQQNLHINSNYLKESLILKYIFDNVIKEKKHELYIDNAQSSFKMPHLNIENVDDIKEKSIVYYIFHYIVQKYQGKININNKNKKKNAILFYILILQKSPFEVNYLFNLLSYIGCGIMEFIYSFEFYNDDNQLVQSQYTPGIITLSSILSINKILILSDYFTQYTNILDNNEELLMLFIKNYKINNFNYKIQNRYINNISKLIDSISYYTIFNEIIDLINNDKLDILEKFNDKNISNNGNILYNNASYLYEIIFNNSKKNINYIYNCDTQISECIGISMPYKNLYNLNNITHLNLDKFIYYATYLLNYNIYIFVFLYLNYLLYIPENKENFIIKIKNSIIISEKYNYINLLLNNDLLSFFDKYSSENKNQKELLNNIMFLLMLNINNIDTYNELKKIQLNNNLSIKNLIGYEIHKSDYLNERNMVFTFNSYNNELKLFYNYNNSFTIAFFDEKDKNFYFNINNSKYYLDEDTNDKNEYYFHYSLYNINVIDSNNNKYTYILQYNLLIFNDELIDINNSIKYNIINIKSIPDNKLLSLLVSTIPNSLLLENNNNYSIILFFNKYLLLNEDNEKTNKEKDSYYDIKKNKNYINTKRSINDDYIISNILNNSIEKYYIFDIHYTNLFIKNNDIETISIFLYLLLKYGDVIFTLNTYKKYFYLLQTLCVSDDPRIINISEINNINDKYKLTSFLFYKIRTIDTPLWFLFINDLIISQQIIKNMFYKKGDYYELRMELLNNYTQPNINKNRNIEIHLNHENLLLNTTFKKIIKGLKDISKLYKKEIIKNNYTNIDNKLNSFLNKVLYIYNNDLKPKINQIIKLNQTSLNNINFNMMKQTIDYNLKNLYSYIGISDLEFIFKKDIFFTINDLYIIYYNKIYNYIFKKTLVNILKSIPTNNMINNLFIIGEIIKPLDSDIINLPYEGNKRNFYQILFELENEFFISNDQIRFIENLKHVNKNETIYQLLMGRGKTAVITPLIILQNLFSNNSKYDNYGIILPSNLINTSANILINYTKYIYNMKFEVFDEKNNLNIKNTIYIIDDKNIKLNILEKIIDNNNNNSRIINESSLFIIDEIDTILDPLKSNLNIIKNSEKYELNNDIFEYIFNKVYKHNNSIILKIQPKLKQIIDEIFNIINDNWIYKKNYGFGDYQYTYNFIEPLINNNFYTAVPYNFNNDPINGSKFSDYIYTLICTINCYKQTGIREEDILLFIYFLISKKQKLFIKHLYPNLSDFIMSNINEIFKIGNNKIVDIVKIIYSEKKNNSNLKDKNILYEYLSKIIIPLFFNIDKYHYNITFLDILYYMKNKIMFTGTPDIVLPKDVVSLLPNELNEESNLLSLYKSIEYDDYSMGSIKASIQGILYMNHKKPRLFKNNSENSDENSDENKLLNFLKLNILNYQSLIDVGGFIINKSVDNMVIFISDIFKGKKKILYVNSKGTRLLYQNGKNEIYSNQIIHTDDIFIYYDQKNSVGIDFKQPYIMKGLITVNINSSTLTDIAQGIFRLRKINSTHSINFFINSKEEIKLNDLLLILDKNGIKKKKNKELSLQNQCKKYIIRRTNDKSISMNDKYRERVYSIIDINRENNLITKYPTIFSKYSFTSLNNSNVNGEIVDEIVFDREQNKNKNKNKNKDKNINLEKIRNGNPNPFPFELFEFEINYIIKYDNFDQYIEKLDKINYFYEINGIKIYISIMLVHFCCICKYKGGYKYPIIQLLEYKSNNLILISSYEYKLIENIENEYKIYFKLYNIYYGKKYFEENKFLDEIIQILFLNNMNEKYDLLSIFNFFIGIYSQSRNKPDLINNLKKIFETFKYNYFYKISYFLNESNSSHKNLYPNIKNNIFTKISKLNKDTIEFKEQLLKFFYIKSDNVEETYNLLIKFNRNVKLSPKNIPNSLINIKNGNRKLNSVNTKISEVQLIDSSRKNGNIESNSVNTKISEVQLINSPINIKNGNIE